MTYKLPFNLKQKPVRKYFEGGSISFSCRDQKLYATLTITKRSRSGIIDSDGINLIIRGGFNKWKYGTIEVTSKEQLDKLLSIKNISELPTIEVVS